MSMDWKYISSHEEGCIDIIYCSNVDLKIPIKYSWTILFKNGTEIDLFENEIKSSMFFLNPIDKNAYKQALENAQYLDSKSVY
jgi:hypothetical protein